MMITDQEALFGESVRSVNATALKKIKEAKSRIEVDGQPIYICPLECMFDKIPQGLDIKTAFTYADAGLLGLPKTASTLDLVINQGRVYLYPTNREMFLRHLNSVKEEKRAKRKKFFMF